MTNDRSRDQLLVEIDELRQRLDEQEAVLRSRTELKYTVDRKSEVPKDIAPQGGTEVSQTDVHEDLEAIVRQRTRELRKVNELLSISEARYKSVIEDQTECIVRWMPDGTVTFANHAYCRYFGLTAAEASSRNYFDLTYVEDRDAVRAKIAKLCVANPVAVDEHRVVLHDGDVGWQQWVDRAVFDDRGQLVEYQSVGRDITDRKTAEQRLTEHRAMLARASRLSAMSEMAAELIHELNQPLVAIHNYAQAIQHAANKGAEANLDFIVQCSESIDEVAADASSVIGRLRKYATRRTMNLAPVQINDLIVKLLELMHFDLQSQHAQLDLQLSPDLPTVDADAVQIEQVFVNLIRNALEALASQDPGDRRIIIRTQPQNNGLQVSVADNGPGVAEEFVGHVFRPFQTTKEGGLGLGLAISESIVADHRGRMWHAAVMPHGARFHFTLPRCAGVLDAAPNGR